LRELNFTARKPETTPDTMRTILPMPLSPELREYKPIPNTVIENKTNK
jgi:hypothetical protein